jgi:hypothetical protein
MHTRNVASVLPDLMDAAIGMCSPAQSPASLRPAALSDESGTCAEAGIYRGM